MSMALQADRGAVAGAASAAARVARVDDHAIRCAGPARLLQDTEDLHVLAQGARGGEPAKIVAAVRGIASGRRCIAHPVAQLLTRQLEQPRPAQPHRTLNDRELQVLLRLARGQNTPEAARALSLSAQTVSTHRTRIMEKLGLHSNDDVTYDAPNSGLID